MLTSSGGRLNDVGASRSTTAETTGTSARPSTDEDDDHKLLLSRLPPTPAQLAAEEQQNCEAKRNNRRRSSRLFPSWPQRQPQDDLAPPKSIRIHEEPPHSSGRVPRTTGKRRTAHLDATPDYETAASARRASATDCLVSFEDSRNSTTPGPKSNDSSRIGALRSFISKPRRWRGSSSGAHPANVREAVEDLAPISPRVKTFRETFSTSTFSSAGLPISRAATDKLVAMSDQDAPVAPERGSPIPPHAIMKEGMLDKWTGQIGRWKERYVVIQPGVLKYKQTSSTVTRHVPLASVQVERGRQDSPMISLRTGNGMLHLRVQRRSERSDWIKAIIKAKQQRDSPLALRHPRPITASSIDAIEPFAVGESPSLAQGDALDDWLSDEAMDLQPMKRLAEVNTDYHARQCATMNELAVVTSRMIHNLALIRDPLTGSLREQLTTLLKLTDQLRESMELNNRAVAKLGQEELHEMHRLQTSLKRTLKENWKLERRVHKLTSKVSKEDLEATDGLTPGGPKASPILVPRPDPSPPSIKLPPDTTEEFFDIDDDEVKAAAAAKDVTAPTVNTSAEASAARPPSLAPTDEDPYVDDDDLSSSDTTSSDSILTDTDEALMHSEPPAIEPMKVVETAVVLRREPSDCVIGDSTRVELGLPRIPNVILRTRLPMPRTEFKISMWSLLKDCVGKDLSRIALPVYFNEPTSFLQRLAEDYQYSHLLEKAAVSNDPMERLLWTSIYTMTPFASAVGRSYKPFNPLLGETYEMIHRGFRFHGEQVGHHPPTSAYHAHGKGYTANGHLTVHTKFTGKSLEVSMQGPSNILLKHPKGHEELYTFQKARMIVNNIIFGRISIDMAGTYTVTNHATGDYGVVEFPKKGWWNKDVHPIRGLICDSLGRCRYRFHGIWSQGVTAEKLLPSIEKLPPNYRIQNPTNPLILYPRKSVDFTTAIWTSLQGDKSSPPFLAWQVDQRPSYAAQFYEFGYMTFELNEIIPLYDRKKGAILPPTDSRYRPDQRALEEGDVDLSNTEKVRLEEKQRAAARALPRGEKDHRPGWYTRTVDPVLGCEAWSFDKVYWKARESMTTLEAQELYKRRCHDIF